MTGAPLCPLHGTPMQKGRKNYYCPKLAGAGEPQNDKGYCIQTQPLAAPTPPATAAGPMPSGASLHAAALQFAGELYHGLGPQFEDAAIECAVRAYQAMKGLA